MDPLLGVLLAALVALLVGLIIGVAWSPFHSGPALERLTQRLGENVDKLTEARDVELVAATLAVVDWDGFVIPEHVTVPGLTEQRQKRIPLVIRAARSHLGDRDRLRQDLEPVRQAVSKALADAKAVPRRPGP